jgi:hypothetical protein
MTHLTGPRSVPEWIGATPDTAIPDRVKLRVYDAHGGICHIARRKIRPGEPWDAEHVKAIINGGENRESNLAPALRDKHPIKTAADLAEKAMVYRKRKKHLGFKVRGQKLPGCRDSFLKKKMNGEVVIRATGERA